LKKLLAALVALTAFAALLYYSFAQGPAPKVVSFAKVSRQNLTSTIVTNGKIEPSGYTAVRAPRDGAMVRILIEKGQRVRAGQVVAEMDAAGLEAEARAAEARVAEARAELALIARGGAAPALTEVDNGLAVARLDLEAARRERDKVARLVDKQAETRESLTAASDRIRQIEVRIEGLERSRSALSPAGRREPALAKLREAEAAHELIEQRKAQGLVRAAAGGVVFSLALRPGAFVHQGDLIAELGSTGAVKAIVYVDEPELGRVALGMPVRITWDALPDRVWDATVEKLPTQITPLNSRQVGEVGCTVPIDGALLPPGANINAEVVSRQVTGALAIPKAALRREGQSTGVLALKRPENKLEWRAVQIGTSSVTYAEVAKGLQEGELVALPGADAFSAGEIVAPKLP
jgi:HlyD family secretion protein